MERITTSDGTETLFNEEFNEAYHSIKAGAFTESLKKFVIPCRIKELGKKQKVIRILDVGFGLGYNVATAVYTVRQEGLNTTVEVISIEKDRDIFEKIKSITIPQFLQPVYNDILSGKIKGDRYIACGKNLRLKVLFGEGRQIIKGLKLKFDAVFFDPFSPRVNTEMWTVELFKEIKRVLKPEGILATYSGALAVRKGLIEAGFRIGLIEPVGRKGHSTVASVKADLPPLTEREKVRLETSPYATPYRDNQDLTAPREEIKKRWEREVGEKMGENFPL
ncbi:MAG: hypothetical protein GXO45_04025 [Aquificae bacterium]|nr:hypothetical protein [Aquificota bacterium]